MEMIYHVFWNALSMERVQVFQDIFVSGHSHTHYLKPKDKIVGQDVHGNLYMEDYTSQYGRHRWVVYSNHDDYADGPTSIPPEWHGWLHYIHDQRADDFSKEYKPPIYQAAPTPTKSGYSDQNYYVPKGHWRHPGVATKSWKKYSAWKP
eukprot:CAMPEP_0114289660 /NCGR_PEP_ID=MMETSP0059-20121206/7500_1 /TAXON_ID=36894 /ORGANISM="Pyramimonas parkeae, Strain CCMP726" /LENGTH=148 /DNA_ID=CAMNT_0001410963 /DNA_START=610 /DNA_END=1056 /DNA_ORIENTATION=+